MKFMNLIDDIKQTVDGISFCIKGVGLSQIFSIVRLQKILEFSPQFRVTISDREDDVS